MWPLRWFMRARMAGGTASFCWGTGGITGGGDGLPEGQYRPDGLVLWDPTYDGRAYLLQMLRQHLSAQLATAGRVTVTREELLKRMLAGERVPVEGYAFSDEFCAEL
jgi:hypothetical protein